MGEEKKREKEREKSNRRSKNRHHLEREKIRFPFWKKILPRRGRITRSREGTSSSAERVEGRMVDEESKGERPGPAKIFIFREDVASKVHRGTRD